MSAVSGIVAVPGDIPRSLIAAFIFQSRPQSSELSDPTRSASPSHPPVRIGPMRALEVSDNVALKQDTSLYGSVLRTNLDSFDSSEDELIIAHAEVPTDVLNEFLVTGVPPAGYVFVQFADETTGSSLVSEDDLVLLSRAFEIGDHVKRDGSSMTGAVIGVKECYTLEPIALRKEAARLFPIDASSTECTPACDSQARPPFSHPNSHRLIYNVSSDDLERAQDMVEDDYIICNDWLGLVYEVEYDVVIALENKSIVVVHGIHGLYVPIPDHGKPLVTLPETDGFRRPDFVGATQGWSSTIPVRTPRPGYFVIIDRRQLRGGRWLRGSYDHKCPAQGVVLDVRTRDASVDWLLHKFGAEDELALQMLPPGLLPIYENIGTFRDQATLRLRKDVTMYDAGRMPTQGKTQAVTSGPSFDAGRHPEVASTRHNSPGLNLPVGSYVRFRDATAAAVKYQGSNDTSHGRFVRVCSEEFHGWDLNEFNIVHIQQEASVLWQNGTTTTTNSSLLEDHGLFEAELSPTDIVLKREGMRQRPVASGQRGSTGVRDFDEMAFFERPHDLLPQKVGVVQTVDPDERVVRVRWYKEPKIEIQSSGQLLAQHSHFGPIGDDVEDVSLYEIMSFASLARRRRDMCVIAPPEVLSKQAQDLEGPQPSTGASTQASASMRGAGFSLSMPRRGTFNRGPRPLHELPTPGGTRLEKGAEWMGTIVDLGLDGSITVRLGGAQPCRDICVHADSIVAVLDDREQADQMSDTVMGGDYWDDFESDWSDEESVRPVSESVEYEGGERLDNDSGDENWVSEDEEFVSAEEDHFDSQDVDMADDESSTTIQLQHASVDLPSLLGAEEPPQFLVLDREPPRDQFGLHSSQTSGATLKRIAREHRILATSLPEGEIYVRTYESRMDLLRCLIIGPRETPYENAPFLIDLYLPEGFPDTPPTAHFHSWTSGLGRINPNLYEEGKICLSLLGTWSGKNESEQWSEKATLLQVLVSLQGLVFVKKPFYNEAGFEGYEHDTRYLRESEQYSEKAFLMARGFVKHALLRPPGGLEDVLAWLYLPHSPSNPAKSLLGTVIERSRLLIERSQEARANRDDQLLDAAGVKDIETRVFLRPLSLGASVMLKRITNELQAQLDRLSGNGTT